MVGGGDDCRVNVWNTENYDSKIQLELKGERNPGRIHCLQFSSDNTGLVCSSDIQVVRLWNLQNRQVLKMLRGKTNNVQSTIFINEQTLATAHDDCTIKIWNLAQKSCSNILTNHTGRVGSLSIAGEILVSCSSDDSSAILWDVSAGRSLQSIEASATSRHEIRCAAISPSRQMLAVAGDDACVKVWQIRNDEIQNETKTVLKGHEGWIRAIAFSPDSQLLASGGDDQMLRIWDMSSVQWGTSVMQPKSVWKKGHIHRIRCLAFSPDGSLLASSSDDGSIKLWLVSSGECVRRFKAAEKALGICSIAFSPDGKFLASGSDDSIVRIWNVDDKRFEELPERHSMGILSVALSPSGRSLVSSSLDGEIRIWDFETKKSWLLA
jgi:WD40 repeat protein